MRVILVTGVGGPAGRAVVQLLHERNTGENPFSIVGADMKPVELPGLSSCAEVPPVSDSRFLPAMRELVAGVRADLIIPTVQDELAIVSAARDVIVPASCDIVVSAPSPTYLSSDKLLTMYALQDAGVSVPRFDVMSAFTSAEHALDLMQGPAVVKPRVSRGGRGVQVVEKAEDIEWDRTNGDLIVQQFAPGDEFCPQVYRSPSTGQTTVVVLQKTELKEGRVGNAVSTERLADGDAADIAGLAEQTVLALDLVGPVDMDIRRLASGAPVVLEVNCRFGANSARAPELVDLVLRDYFAQGSNR